MRDVAIAFDLIGKRLGDKPRRVVDLCVEMSVSEDFLHQIVRKLNKFGFVEVVRGPGGGVKAGKMRQAVNLKTLYEAMGHAGAMDDSVLQAEINQFMENTKP